MNRKFIKVFHHGGQTKTFTFNCCSDWSSAESASLRRLGTGDSASGSDVLRRFSATPSRSGDPSLLNVTVMILMRRDEYHIGKGIWWFIMPQLTRLEDVILA